MADEKQERLPSDRNQWAQFSLHGLPVTASLLSASRWISGPIIVVSALEEANYPDGAGIGPQWHISITARGKRPKPHHVRRALRAFGMVGAEEDNHHPGNARHYWMPVDPTHRVDCECKTDEKLLTESDGYRWTNPHKQNECRGCAIAPLTKRPCPVHGAQP